MEHRRRRPDQARKADTLIRKLRDRFAPGGFLHYGQGKWYPGETLPRWTFSLYWRRDEKPIWHDPELIADEGRRRECRRAEGRSADEDDRRQAGDRPGLCGAGLRGPAVWLVKEANLPENVTPANSEAGRRRGAHRIAQGLRPGPGDTGRATCCRCSAGSPKRQPGRALAFGTLETAPGRALPGPRRQPGRLPPAAGIPALRIGRRNIPTPTCRRSDRAAGSQPNFRPDREPTANQDIARFTASEPNRTGGNRRLPADEDLSEGAAVRTAMSVEPRDGRLCVFMPPVERIEDYLELVAVAESAAAELGCRSISKAIRRRPIRA